ncbi:ABC transporter ATP-binding protein [Romboutsia sp. CE17]|uniref:ABC transporter ATP-binding protein n=1 Tax=Romboutsia sp. CE17 TaxID=2724150 RepID=UPI001442CEF7|nr:ABC transporter ATP-binding protein [Romboutsia sp. CE17]QJA08741.1 ABC transporter ATP-binding protein [Romboutsia sp. CE17]
MLKVKNLSKSYKGNNKAIENISFEINKGDIFGFIGHNGAGKTTTIKCIVGIHDFEEGEILINSKSIKSNPVECKKDIAYIPDNPDLYESLTAIQYLNFIANIFNVNKNKREELIYYYSDKFEIKDSLGDLISSYSHGMKQKLAIISALIHSPKILILDEPFVGLDPKATFILKEIMKEFCNNGGCIFFSTHVLDVAEKICNKIAIINGGKLIKTGNTLEVKGDKSLESLFMELIENE